MVNYTGYDFGAVTTPESDVKAKELAVWLNSWVKHSKLNMFPLDVLNKLIDLGMVTKTDIEQMMKEKNIPFPTLPTGHV